MVGPLSEADRRAGNRKIAAGFVALVGFSGGMSALYGGATPIEAAVVVAVGLVVGVGLLVALGVGR